SNAAKEVGGFGGGHKIAAGATIPKGKENEFLKLLDENLKI
ncbi:MAG: DHHA1 domain-containing protein, partial [Thermoplasmata archaeon]